MESGVDGRVEEQSGTPVAGDAELERRLADQPPWVRAFVPQLHRLRDAELRRVMPCLLEAGRDARVLEIGGGDGWQAAQLSEVFASVTSIDIEGAHYGELQVHPVVEYDGHRIPLPDGSIDLVFSSNVLEHIPHVSEFQSEIPRVLSPAGRAVHVLPSASWVFWGLLAHFPELPRWAFWQLTWRLSRLGGSAGAAAPAPDDAPPPSSHIGGAPLLGAGGRGVKGILKSLFEILLPHRHGERGNVFGELWLFSRKAWHPLFRRTGWCIDRSEPLHLFYTGKTVFGTGWSIESRTRWSRLLGSSSHLTVLMSADAQERRAD